MAKKKSAAKPAPAAVEVAKPLAQTMAAAFHLPEETKDAILGIVNTAASDILDLAPVTEMEAELPEEDSDNPLAEETEEAEEADEEVTVEEEEYETDGEDAEAGEGEVDDGETEEGVEEEEETDAEAEPAAPAARYYVNSEQERINLTAYSSDELLSSIGDEAKKLPKKPTREQIEKLAIQVFGLKPFDPKATTKKK